EDARRGEELHRQADLFHDRAVRDDRRGAALQRAREERPGEQTDEEEDRERLLARRRDRPALEQDPEQDPEHDELEQRVEEIPGEPEGGALVPRPELAPREARGELAPIHQRADVAPGTSAYVGASADGSVIGFIPADGTIRWYRTAAR